MCLVHRLPPNTSRLSPLDEVNAALAGLGARLMCQIGDLGRHGTGLEVAMYELPNGQRVIVQRQAHNAVELWLPQEAATSHLLEKLHQLSEL